MVGCLGLVVLVRVTLWATTFGDSADFSGSWTPPEYWDADDVALEMSEFPKIWTGGSREDFSSLVEGLRLLVLVFICLLLLVAVDFSVWGTAEE